MSNYLDTVQEFELTGILKRDTDRVGRDSIEALMNIYKEAPDDKKAALDKHALEVLNRKANEINNKNIKSIKKNLQFIAWILIINISAGALYLLYN